MEKSLIFRLVGSKVNEDGTVSKLGMDHSSWPKASILLGRITRKVTKGDMKVMELSCIGKILIFICK